MRKKSVEQEKEMLDKMMVILEEHFDCIQILVSKLRPDGGTESHFRGSGNWYARQGMAYEFIDEQKSREMAQQIKIANEDSE